MFCEKWSDHSSTLVCPRIPLSFYGVDLSTTVPANPMIKKKKNYLSIVDLQCCMGS